MDRIKNILFIILLALLFAPLIQQQTGLFRERHLTGSASPLPYPKLSGESWITGDFQAAFEQSTEEHLGFRASLIRLKNQIQYSLFRKANARGVVVGKKRFLYEYDYIRAFTGLDFLGDWFWQEKFRRFGLVRDTLNRLGVEMALVLEPGKASYYPGYIPEAYLKHRKDSTNYRQILHQAELAGLPLLDLNQFFLERKGQVPVPDYTREGIHWSYQGMLYSVDTLLDFSRQIVKEQIPDFRVLPGEITDEPRDTDNDLGRLLNLIRTPARGPYHYPFFTVDSVPTELRPRVLAVSDSYYFNMLNAGIPRQVFANEAFWYYSSAIYPQSWTEPLDTSMISIQEEVEAMDLLLVMVTERFYFKLAWNFIERLYDLYYPEAVRDLTYDYCTRILTDFEWFDLVVRDARNRQVAVGTALREHADYQFWKDDQAGLVPKDVSYYVRRILKDPEWSGTIREKAEANQITFEKQLYLDALWMTQQF